MKIIILLGPPGSGKGTQANLLAEKLGFYHFETSKIIEHKIKISKKDEFIETEGKKYFLKDEKKKWEEGELCSPPFVVRLLKEKIALLCKEDEEIVFSGSPRTLHEAEKMAPFLGELYGKEDIKIINISISAEQSIWRNSHRRICELMRHSILWTEENKNLKHCPLDGSKLIKRKLDDSETIKIRLEEYKNRTFPVIEFLKKEKFSIIGINGEQTVAGVFGEILSKLKI